jgi:hypothetical protein
MSGFSGDEEWDQARREGRGNTLPNVWRPPDYDPTGGMNNGGQGSWGPTPSYGVGGGGGGGGGSASFNGDTLLALFVFAMIGVSVAAPYMVPVFVAAVFVHTRRARREPDRDVRWLFVVSVCQTVAVTFAFLLVLGGAMAAWQSLFGPRSEDVSGNQAVGLSDSPPAVSPEVIETQTDRGADVTVNPVATEDLPREDRQPVEEVGTLEPGTTTEQRVPPVAVARVTVVHDHAFGSCRGALVLAEGRLRFETDDVDDSFDVGLMALERPERNQKSEWSVIVHRPDDKSKRYNFRIADARDATVEPEEGLEAIHSVVSLTSAQATR